MLLVFLCFFAFSGFLHAQEPLNRPASGAPSVAAGRTFRGTTAGDSAVSRAWMADLASVERSRFFGPPQSEEPPKQRTGRLILLGALLGAAAGTYWQLSTCDGCMYIHPVYVLGGAVVGAILAVAIW